jgi:hypothetical protein
MSNILNAFIEQTYSPYGGIEEYEKKCDEVMSIADNKRLSWYKEAEEQLGSSQDISDYMTILTGIENGSLDEKAESHSYFKGYDHSLEQDRLAELRSKYNYVEPERNKDIVELSEMQIESVPICENNSFDLDLSGLFDNSFGLD